MPESTEQSLHIMTFPPPTPSASRLTFEAIGNGWTKNFFNTLSLWEIKAGHIISACSVWSKFCTSPARFYRPNDRVRIPRAELNQNRTEESIRRMHRQQKSCKRCMFNLVVSFLPDSQNASLPRSLEIIGTKRWTMVFCVSWWEVVWRCDWGDGEDGCTCHMQRLFTPLTRTFIPQMPKAKSHVADDSPTWLPFFGLQCVTLSKGPLNVTLFIINH